MSKNNQKLQHALYKMFLCKLQYVSTHSVGLSVANNEIMQQL